MTKFLHITLSLFALLFGIFLFIYGGYDDSPGAQGLGLIVVAIDVIQLVKLRKKRSLRE